MEKILSQSELENIIHGNTADPFSLLGMHKLNKEELVVRVFNPFAEKVNILIDKKSHELNKVADEGLVRGRNGRSGGIYIWVHSVTIRGWATVGAHS